MLRSRIALLLVLISCIGYRSKASAQPSPSSVTPSSSSSAAPGAKSTPSQSAQAAASPSAQTTPSAQATPHVPLTNLPDVSITATRISQPLSQIGVTTTVIPAQSVQDQKIQMTSDALRQVPGVVVTQSGGPGTITDVSIRGSNTDQVLTMLDGVEVNSGTAGSYDFANLTTQSISRLEVVRGGGASLYGSSAIGGVINQITEEGYGPPKFSLLSDGGNWQTQRQIATASGAEGKLGYAGSVSYYSTGGFQPFNGSNDNLSLVGRLDYHLTDDTTLRGFARYTFANVGLPEFSNEDFSNPQNLLDPSAHQRTEFMLYKGEIDSHLTDKLLVRAFGSYVRDEIRINKVPTPGIPNGENDDIPDEIWGFNAEAVYTWAEGITTLVGYDFKYRWARSGDNSFSPGPPPSTSITVFTASREEYAGYLQQQARLLDGHVLLTGGFRVDGNSQFGKEVSPSWSVAIPFEQYGLVLRGNYQEGFEAPTFDELYFPGFGNPNLQATTSSEYDGGIQKNFGEWASITTTYFSRRIHDLIVTVPCPTCTFGFEPANVGRADMQGVEVVPAVYPVKGLSLSGQFTALDSTHRPLIATLQPVRVPTNSASAVLEYKAPNIFHRGDQFTSALFYQFIGDREDLDTNAPFTEHNHSNYQYFNLTLSYKLGEGLIPVPHLRSTEAFVRIQNLFDRNYSEAFGFPAPPINFEAGAKLGF